MRFVRNTLRVVTIAGLVLLGRYFGIEWQELLRGPPAVEQQRGEHAVTSPITGMITRFTDGDSFRFKSREGETSEVRLWGIDAPEGRQAGGREARAELQRLVGHNRQLVLKPVEYDKYERIVANAYCGTLWINLAMIESGWAWHYIHFSDDERLAAAEAEARAARRGLWQESAPVAPWEWRRRAATPGREKSN